MNTSESPNRSLSQLLCEVSDPSLMLEILEALLTPRELQEIDNRIQIFRLLAEHTPQRKIAEQLNVGIATVTRGAQVYRDSHLFVSAPDIFNNFES